MQGGGGISVPGRVLVYRGLLLYLGGYKCTGGAVFVYREGDLLFERYLAFSGLIAIF